MSASSRRGHGDHRGRQRYPDPLHVPRRVGRELELRPELLLEAADVLRLAVDEDDRRGPDAGDHLEDPLEVGVGAEGHVRGPAGDADGARGLARRGDVHLRLPAHHPRADRPGDAVAGEDQQVPLVRGPVREEPQAHPPVEHPGRGEDDHRAGGVDVLLRELAGVAEVERVPPLGGEGADEGGVRPVQEQAVEAVGLAREAAGDVDRAADVLLGPELLEQQAELLDPPDREDGDEDLAPGPDALVDRLQEVHLPRALRAADRRGEGGLGDEEVGAEAG
eukprot:CAMPEP_0114486620 /NCGR_PEP_ID=MMETSP0109-20121206/311_1 /TAXON_ID=29199 /ORGANISM="Chlorarachnion reptans, Strain CCCM449" /LENGTH=277 /DNA_ID=CAMNT_0001662793 /DNA_START=670 /DNA_END=1499 /DNA_ORIENTATION=+